jgi:hypothetical protein
VTATVTPTTSKEDIMTAQQPIGEPSNIVLADLSEIELIRLGDRLGLGIATGDGAAMAALTKAEQRQLGEELIRLAD